MTKRLLLRLPVLLWFSFIPRHDGAYSSFSFRRVVVMFFFWPIFSIYLVTTWFFFWLDHLFFPRFRYIKIVQPVFVLGIPRSGTTFLHRLLAGDTKRFTSMTLGEIIFAPSITQRYIWKAVGNFDSKLGSPCRKLLIWMEQKLFSSFDDVHKTRLNDAEEDYLALSPILNCFLLVLPFGDPKFFRLTRFDELATKAEKNYLKIFYRKLIQRHLFFHGETKVYLSKNPSFTSMSQTLLEEFPDALFVGCIRNPNQAVPSQLSSMLIGARIFSSKVDESWWRNNLSSMLQHYYSYLFQSFDGKKEAQQFLVRMENLSTAPFETVKRIYKRFNLEMDDAYLLWLLKQAKKSQSYRSEHHYVGIKLGISDQALKDDFGFVYTKLGYPPPGGLRWSFYKE